MKFQKIVLLTALIFAIFWGTICIAAEITVPITDYAIIEHQGLPGRLLLTFSLPSDLSDSTLDFAELTFGINPILVGDSILTINCHALSTDWNVGSVAWDYPWQEPGGDFEESELTMYTSDFAEPHSARFDLTETAHSWLQGNRTSFGLIFILPDWIQSRFALYNLPDLPENAIGQIRFETK